MRSLGTGAYQPSVFAHFPRTARGHGSQGRYKREYTDGGVLIKGARRSELCNAVSCVLRTGKGERHQNQEQNRKDWEESVGIRHTASRATRSAARQAIPNNDPKGRKS